MIKNTTLICIALVMATSDSNLCAAATAPDHDSKLHEIAQALINAKFTRKRGKLYQEGADIIDQRPDSVMVKNSQGATP